MGTAVKYYSKSGNTKKLATAIADELNAKAEAVDTTLEEMVHVLFMY